MTLSPILKERIEKFRRSKRAYWSLIILIVLFLASLPAELICNDKPYAIRYQGKWYWPAFSSYTKRDFGFDSDLPISDYKAFVEELEEPIIMDTSAIDDSGDGKTEGGEGDILDELYGDDSGDLDLGDDLDLGLEDEPEPEKKPKTGDAGSDLFGDDNEDVDIDELIRRQDEGEDVVGSPAQWPTEKLLYQLFGDDDENVDMDDLLARQDAGEDVYHRAAPASTESVNEKKVEVFTLWPPIRYHAKTENTYHTTERGWLIGPFAYTSSVTGEEVPGATQDGHWLGTDAKGRDVLARLIYGFRISLVFGFGLALTGTIVGCLLGGLQGYFGGWTDLLGQRATEIWGSMPRLFLLIILSSFLANYRQLMDSEHFAMLFGILNLTTWMGMASHMRAQFLRARNLDYVKAAKALGQSDFKIMMKHILPNSLVPVVTFVPFAITGGITALVSLDFLGFGVKYPAPSLGDLLAQGQTTMKWWIIIPTVIILSITLILLTFVGEGVRNAFDPRRKN